MQYLRPVELSRQAGSRLQPLTTQSKVSAVGDQIVIVGNQRQPFQGRIWFPDERQSVPEAATGSATDSHYPRHSASWITVLDKPMLEGRL